MGRNRTEAEEAEEEYSPAEMEVYEGDRERAAWERQAALERAAWDPNTTVHQLADLFGERRFCERHVAVSWAVVAEFTGRWHQRHGGGRGRGRR